MSEIPVPDLDEVVPVPESNPDQSDTFVIGGLAVVIASLVLCAVLVLVAYFNAN